jgi:type IV pilus assembly protein PilQ
MFQTGKFLRLIFLASSLLAFGCAQQMKSVQTEVPPEVMASGEIKSIAVSDDAARIDITSDRSIVYTYYLLDSPPKIVIDLAQVTASGSLAAPMELNRGNIRRIDVTKHEFGSGVLSRVEISLKDKSDVSAFLDPKDKRHLTLHLVQSAPIENKVVEQTVSAPAQTAVVAESPVVKAPAVAPEVQPASAASAEMPAVATKQETGSQPGEAKDNANPLPEGAVSQPATNKAQNNDGTGTLAVKSAGPRALTGITKLDDGVKLIFSADVDVYNAFKLSDPERLVVDIPKTKNGIPTKIVEINSFNLGKARFGGTADKLRIVFDGAGKAIPPYAVTRVENGLVILFGESARKAIVDKNTEGNPHSVVKNGSGTLNPTDAAAPSAPVLVSAPAQPNVPSKGTAKPGVIDAIEFTQADGLSRITLKTGGGCAVSEPAKSAKGLYIAMKGCRLPAKLQRQLDTRGFDSVIKEIVPYPVKSKGAPEVRLAVNMRTAAPNSLKREGNVFTWEFREPAKPVKMTRPVKTLKSELPAEKIGASDSKADNVEKEIGEQRLPQKSKPEKGLEDAFTNDKIVQTSAKPGKQYTGRKVSLEFSDADIRKIFQLIAEVSNQNFLIADDVSGTISLKLVNVPWDQALDVILESKNLGMQKDGNIVQIRPKSKMKSLDDEAIEMRLTEEKKMPLSTVIFDVNFATLTDIETQFKNLKSKRTDTSVSIDTRTNKIIVVDIDPNIKKMRGLLESLDVPEKQVMIEARIVEASSSFARDIGIKWNFGYQDASASVANINNITGSMGGIVSNVLPSATTGGLAAGMAFGKLLSNIQLDMRLSAAATVGQVKIISTPKVLTVNNKAAKISQGQMIPYQNTSSTEGAKTEFIEAALSLDVTPHITADGSVNMKIKASNNSVGTGSPPPINKKEATTELVVKNGETTVIGGIYVDSETEGDTGIPYLSDIPLLGWLFKSNSKNKTKNELLIFITPKIMS